MEGGAEAQAICTSLLVKLAMRCNIACTYCYWFRDADVMKAPALLGEEVEAALCERLDRHLARHRPASFSLTFHGGEPLLFPKARFDALCGRLRAIEGRTGVALRLQITTNGLLVDPEWVALFRRHRVGVALSVDGTPATHDRRRLDFQGRGTWARTLRGLEVLRAGGIEPGILAVCDPSASADALIESLVERLDLRAFDVLVGDATHDDPRPPSVAAFYTRLFDRWYDELAARGVEIRLFSGLVRGLLGGDSGIHSLGIGGITTATLTTDGSLEALDVLRIAGTGRTRSAINVLTHELQEVERDPLWREVLEATRTLPSACRSCPVRHTCGGGHVASRWSSARRLDNPSVHCDDYKEIIAHVWRRIAPDLTIELPADAAAELPTAGPAERAG